MQSRSKTCLILRINHCLLGDRRTLVTFGGSWPAEPEVDSGVFKVKNVGVVEEGHVELIAGWHIDFLTHFATVPIDVENVGGDLADEHVMIQVGAYVDVWQESDCWGGDVDM